MAGLEAHLAFCETREKVGGPLIAAASAPSVVQAPSSRRWLDAILPKGPQVSSTVSPMPLWQEVRLSIRQAEPTASRST